MRKFLIIIIISFAGLKIFPQKVPVQVTRSINVAASDWQILDDQFNPVLSGNEFLSNDSASFFLEANKRYFMEVSVSEVFEQHSNMYLLFINGEPVLRINSDLGPGDHFFAFVTGIREEQNKITGGTNADIADYPWQVFYESGNYTCGGSIISGDWIITAAHCTEDDSGNEIPVSEMDVIVGANNPRSGNQGRKYYVSKVIRHEKYNSKTYNYDIALLQLQTSIDYENATPIKLISKIDSASGATDPGVMSWVTGYGLTRVTPPTVPTTLQKVQLPIVSKSQASNVWPDIPSTDMMAGYLTGNKDACSGDSGGPLIVPVDNEFKLAGLVSWGSSNCNSYGAYTRVSTFESWISSKTGIEISFVPPVPSGDSIICKGVTSSEYNVGTVDGATSYEWQLLPFGAGTIEGNSGNARVTWKLGHVGSASVRLRVTRHNIVSYWSVLTVHIAEYNKLVSKSNDIEICAGEPVNLRVVSEGYNLNYSWYKNDTLFQSGTSSRISFGTPATYNSGLYRCDITGSCGEGLSPEMNLTVLPVTKIKYISPDTTVAFSEGLTLKVKADGHNLTYQWQKDETQLVDVATPEFSLLNVNATSTGLYRVDVTGSCGKESSSKIYVYVKSKNFKEDIEVYVWPTIVINEFNVALSMDQNYNLLLFTYTGRLLRERKDCQYKTTFNISDLPGGIYILTVYNNDFRKSVKLIKN